jgi:hypothetical protein
MPVWFSDVGRVHPSGSLQRTLSNRLQGRRARNHALNIYVLETTFMNPAAIVIPIDHDPKRIPLMPAMTMVMDIPIYKGLCLHSANTDSLQPRFQIWELVICWDPQGPDMPEPYNDNGEVAISVWRFRHVQDRDKDECK